MRAVQGTRFTFARSGRTDDSRNLSTQEVLAGLVERVACHHVENGSCVLRAKARGHRDAASGE
jgi:hypothetical protein